MYAFLCMVVGCLTYLIGKAMEYHKEIKKYEICISKNDKIKEINL